MGKYNFEHKKKDNLLKVELIGKFTEYDVKNFIIDFLELNKKLRTKDKKLIFACGLSHIYPCEVHQELRGLFELYKSVGFDGLSMNLYKPQKELARKCIELGKLTDFKVEINFIQI